MTPALQQQKNADAAAAATSSYTNFLSPISQAIYSNRKDSKAGLGGAADGNFDAESGAVAGGAWLTWKNLSVSARITGPAAAAVAAAQPPRGSPIPATMASTTPNLSPMSNLSTDVLHESAATNGSAFSAKRLAAAPQSLQLLENVSGYAEPGYMTAIMGPSGSGKSTLLDALAGRLAKNAVRTGDVLVNGRKRQLSYGSVAYVTQESTMLGTLTVRETLEYSAALRLPEKMSAAEKAAVVDGALVEMGLSECAATAVGNWHLRGISGGERRRLSIALEILLRPRLLFLDEPTSGLDSAAAFFVMKTLRALSRDQRRTVLFSIHQPSSQVFVLFDYLSLLSAGRTVYFGPAAAAHEFFAESGFPCPPRRNPSDHFLRCINSDFESVRKSLAKSSAAAAMSAKNATSEDPLLKYATTAEVIDVLIRSYNASEHEASTALRISQISQVEGPILDPGGSLASPWTQCAVLTRRSFVNMSRDIAYYWLRLAIYIFVAICVGSLYYKVGTSYNAILARGACTSYVSGFVTFMSIGSFPSFVEDMKVFHKERLNGHYGVLSFVVANTLSSLPYLMLISFVVATIIYFMAGLHPGFTHYLYFLINLFGCIGVVEALMMAIASVVPNFLMGIITGAGVLGIFMLVAGFFRLPNDLPKVVWRYPMSYISFTYWGLQGQYKNDLLGLEFDNVNPFLPPIPGDKILRERFQIDLSWNKWWDCAMVFASLFLFRIVFLVNIKLNEKVTPHIRAFFARHATWWNINHKKTK